MTEPVRRDWCEEHNRGSLAASDGLCAECQQRTIEHLREEIQGRAANDEATARANAELIAERDAIKDLMKRREDFILGLLWNAAERQEATERENVLMREALTFVLDHIGDKERGPRDLYPAFGLDAQRTLDMVRAALTRP
jgi:hypothetical protein